ncbi:hypothetical protein Dimus_010955, partial [Dionaea muscipula]
RRSSAAFCRRSASRWSRVHRCFVGVSEYEWLPAEPSNSLLSAVWRCWPCAPRQVGSVVVDGRK